jgi:hypothetical protein
MRKWFGITVALVLIATALLAACGGGGKDAPVPMETYEGDTFSINYPKAWETNSMEMFGLSMAIFSTRELGVEDLGGLDFEGMVSEDPVAILMVVPSDMTAEMGMDDLDEAIEDIGPDDDEDVEIIRQGDTTIGGAKGKLIIAKGDIPDVGKAGIHMAIAKRDDGSVVILMGATPDKDLDTNMKVFEAMQNSFAFK